MKQFSSVWLTITRDPEFHQVKYNLDIYQKFTVALESYFKRKGIANPSPSEQVTVGKRLLQVICEIENCPKATIGEKCFCLFLAKIIFCQTEFFPPGTTVEIYDEKHEMEAVKISVLSALRQYAQKNHLTGYCSVTHLGIKKYAEDHEIIFPDDGRGLTTSTCWWLNGAHEVYLSGNFEVKKISEEIYFIKAAELRAIWRDELDANPSFKTDDWRKASIEYAWIPIEWWFNLKIPIMVYWSLKQ